MGKLSKPLLSLTNICLANSGVDRAEGDTLSWLVGAAAVCIAVVAVFIAEASATCVELQTERIDGSGEW